MKSSLVALTIGCLASLPVLADEMVIGGKGPHHHHGSYYEQGFKDGCESGIWYDMSEIKVKDFHLAMSDRGYFHGWDEGFSECRYNIYFKINHVEHREDHRYYRTDPAWDQR